MTKNNTHVDPETEHPLVDEFKATHQEGESWVTLLPAWEEFALKLEKQIHVLRPRALRQVELEFAFDMLCMKMEFDPKKAPANPALAMKEVMDALTDGQRETLNFMLMASRQVGMNILREQQGFVPPIRKH